MITSVSIKNFRSIESMELSLGKINVLTGANNSGKSSVIYALLVLKNAVTNPNQTVDGLFNFEFINLGPFKENVYKKNVGKRKIKVGVSVSNLKTIADYGLEIGQNSSAFF